MIFDLINRTTHTINADRHRHFYGHGCFTDAGLLLTTEQNFQTGVGEIAVRDSHDNYRLIERWPSQGIGPHELLIDAINHQVVVCNGGLRTHPDQGRKTLNPDTMQPNLSRIDLSSGRAVSVTKLSQAHQHLSIRHLDLLADGRAAVGLQSQHKMDQSSLLAIESEPAGPLILQLPNNSAWSQFNGYVGSVRANASKEAVALSSPRGNLIMAIDPLSAQYQHLRISDVCGISGHGQLWQFSSGTGRYGNTYAPLRINDVYHSKFNWDNHLTALPRRLEKYLS